MKVIIDWQYISEASTHLWQLTRCLYSYTDAKGELLYIGKVAALASSVRRRWSRSGKGSFWDFIEQDLGVFEHCTLVGLVQLPVGNRYSPQLLADIETLLIHQCQPPGNVDCKSTRIRRPGLSIQCKGDWPHFRKVFVDN